MSNVDSVTRVRETEFRNSAFFAFAIAYKFVIFYSSTIIPQT